MRILSRHGHYAFYPEHSSEIADFCKAFDITLEREDDFYTFPALKGLKDYSLATVVYKDIAATVNYEGKPWEIMRENEVVYNIGLEKVVPLISITTTLSLTLADGFYNVNVPLIQAGSIVPTGERIVDYDAIFVEEYKQLKVMEVGYV